jgi:hypothetical protein
MALTIMRLLSHSVPLISNEIHGNDEHPETAVIDGIEALCRSSINLSKTTNSSKDKALARIVLARELKQKTPEVMLAKSIELSKLLASLAKGCVPLPTEPVPYLEIATDLHEWFSKERRGMRLSSDGVYERMVLTAVVRSGKQEISQTLPWGLGGERGATVWVYGHEST